MGDKSEIGWTDATWNPVTGCSKVSPGCANCYAESLTMRFAEQYRAPRLPWTPENAEQNVILHPERLDQPIRWRRPRMVFVNSMSDLFHELVPDEFIGQVFAVMAASPHHTFQVLTKRPERARALLAPMCEPYARRAEITEEWKAGFGSRAFQTTWPLPNVWLGTSIENRRFVGRADVLRETPAAVRFISAEPLLGPLVSCRGPSGRGLTIQVGSLEPTPLWWVGDRTRAPREWRSLSLDGIDWLIVGGESGPDHRPIRAEWVRDLRDACAVPRICSRCEGAGVDRGEAYRPCPRCDGNGEAGVAFFFKQWGGLTPKAGGRDLDGRTWDEFPAVVR